MPFVPRLGKVEKISYSASTMKSRDLPKRALKALLLKLAVTHTNGAAAPTITWESLAKLLQKIMLTSNGQDTSVNMAFWLLYVLNYYDASVAPPFTPFTTVSAQGTSLMSLTLPFELTRAVNPKDTIFDARGLSSLVLDAYFGNAIATANEPTINSAELQIDTDEYVGTDPGKPLSTGRHEFSQVTETLSGTGSTDLDLETKGMNQYRRLIFATRNSAGSLSNYIVDNIKIKSGATYYMDIGAKRLQEHNGLQYGVPPLAGIYMYDFTRDGYMTERLDARGLSDLKIEVNVTGVGSVDVLKEKVIYR